MVTVFRFWVSATLIFICSLSYSQALVDVHFEFPNGGTFEIRVDSNKVMTDNKFKLPEGEYFVEIWVPGLKVIIDTILVNPDSYNLYQYSRFEVIPEMAQNKKEIMKYNISKSFVFTSFAPTLLGTYLTISKYRSAQSLFLELSDISDNYNLAANFVSESELEQRHADLSQTYERDRSAYNRNLIITSSALACNVALSYFFFKKRTKPKKYKIESPFAKQSPKVSFMPGINGFTLSLKL